MKFKPIKEGNVTAMTRLPIYRQQLKQYIEKTMIPAIIEHGGDDFLHSLQLGGQRFICDLYNDTWEQYAQERPFEILDFRAFGADSDNHEILYVDVPVLDEMESLCYSSNVP